MGGRGMIVLRGARVFAPADMGIQDVLVAGDRIVAIAPDLSPGPGDWPVEELDLRGRWLIPGLVDTHAHFCGGGGEGGSHTRVPPMLLTQFTRAGVTTGVGLLGTDGTTRSTAELLANARGLAYYGFNAFCYTASYEVPCVTLTGSVKGDIVHIDRIVAAGEVAVSDPRSSQPTYDELVRIAAECHVAGIMTKKAGLLHMHLGDGARGLGFVRRALDETEIPPRVFHPTHVNRNPRLWEEAKAIAARGCTIDVTAFPLDEADPTVHTEVAIAEYLRDGGAPERLTVSSDGGGCLPTFDRDGNLIRMDVGTPSTLLPAVAAAIRLGVEPSLAIATVTRNPADLFRFWTKGRISVGADADLAVVTPDMALEALICGGRWMIRDGEPVVRGIFE